jgi:hypothetical protein
MYQVILKFEELKDLPTTNNELKKQNPCIVVEHDTRAHAINIL